MKKYRRGSKIVDIVKRQLKLNTIAENKQIPGSKYEATQKFNQNAKKNTVPITEFTSNQPCKNDQDKLSETPELDIAFDIILFQNASSQPSTSNDEITKTYSNNVTDKVLENCLHPTSSLTLLNEDLYLTDSSDEYIPEYDEATTSSSDSSDNLNKSPRRFASNTKKQRGNVSGKRKHYVTSSKTVISRSSSKISGQQSKRRPAVPSEWKKNIRKTKRQQGEPYVSAKGVLIPGKTLKESKCMGRCIHKCTSKFTEEERLKTFSMFWDLANVEEKRLYIVSLIQREKAKTFATKPSRKKLTNKYFLKKVGTNEKIRVCQKFFVATLNVSETFLRVCFKKVINNNEVVEDKRGKHIPHNKKSNDIREHVINHIKSFPRLPPPRGRRLCKKEYLSRNLNLTKMYKLYKIKCDNEQRDYVELAYYRSVFNKDFDIGFHRPGRNICVKCSSFEKMSEKEKENQKGTQEEHLKRIVIAKQHREEAKRSAQLGQLHFAEFDLKAIYNGKLSSRIRHILPMFNFTVLDFTEVNRNVLCFCWHEGIARKGAAEIGSCLYKYLKNNADGKTITFVSDTCASQCRNMYISSLLLYCIKVFNIPEINHQYFEQGHSEMETDEIHADIEYAVKNNEFHDPPGFYDIIRNTVGKYPNNVYEMGPDDFIDLKYLKNLLVKNAKKDYRGEPVKWLSIRWFQYRKENPNNIYFKYELDDSEFNIIEVVRRGTRLQNCEEIALLKRPYYGPLY